MPNKSSDTDKVKYPCTDCNRSYVSIYSLNRHQRTSGCNKKSRRGRKPKHHTNDAGKKKTPKVLPVVDDEKSAIIEEETVTVESSISSIEVDPIASSISSTKLELDAQNDLLEQNNDRLRVINESMNRAERDIKDTVCDKYVIARLRDALCIELFDEIKNSNLYSEHKDAIDECIKYFDPPTGTNYTVENVMVKTLENRIDIIKGRADNLNKLKQNKIDLLTENSKLSSKIIELLN